VNKIETEPLVSVIVPTYNRIEKLCRAINSVRVQDYLNWELLIIDDRSIDNTKSVLENYKITDGRIHYYRNEYKQGPSGARNFGIDKAQGKYIAFLDSDDEWFPNHLSECLEILENEKMQICCAKWVENKHNITGNSFPRERALELSVAELNPIKKNNAYLFEPWFGEYAFIRDIYLLKISFLVFEKSILKSSGVFDTKLCGNEDIEFFSRLTMSATMAFIANFHGIYYEGDDNLYFFRNAINIKDKRIVKKLNFHRQDKILCFLKIARIIKNNNFFIHKSLMLYFAYFAIWHFCDFLYKVNKPFNPLLSFYYKILKFFYSWKYNNYQRLGEKYFWYSFSSRFSETVSYIEYNKIRKESFLNLLFHKKSLRSFGIFIENHIYIQELNNNLILYNPANQQILTLKNIHKSRLGDLFKQNRILVSQNDLLNRKISFFIQKIYQFRMGALLDARQYTGDIPFENINTRKEDIQKKYLIKREGFKPELTFYIKNQCSETCAICYNAHLQFKHCLNGGKTLELDFNTISNTILEISHYSKPVINIIGGNIFLYNELDKLVHLFNSERINVNYYINYLHLNEGTELSRLRGFTSKITVIVQFPVNELKLNKVISTIKNEKCDFRLIVQQGKDLKLIRKLSHYLQDKKFDIILYYNGSNYAFFKKQVFLTKKEILKNIDNENIEELRYINKDNVGKLTVLPNGDLYTNLNDKPVGNIVNQSIREILTNEALINSSWFKLRKNVEPCNKCLYNIFCPTITNYEYFLGHKICRGIKIKTTETKETLETN
jgi:pseudo-rSAM protein